MRSVNRQHSEPLNIPRTRRAHPLRVLTSMPAGKMVPVAAIPLLREDSLNGAFSMNAEMLETDEILMNRVVLRLSAYLVPLLAFERFEGSRDQFDRSYMGEPQTEGGDVVPFIETQAFGAHGANEVYKYLGLHAKPTDLVNTAYLESYNAVWNFVAKNRSKDLTPRARLADTLAPAFWDHSRFQHVVPDFEDALMEGEIPLRIVNGELSLKGLDTNVGMDASRGPVRYFAASDPATTYGVLKNPTGGSVVNTDVANASGSTKNLRHYVDLDQIVAELDANGITVSLANIELARKTQAMAKIRERYDGIDEEWVLDMLMSGLTIPDQHLKQPIPLGEQVTRFGQAKRYATDSGNLDQSAVSGGAFVDMRLRVPRVNTGGVVMVFAEAFPEQLFERQRDPFFFLPSVGHLDALPDFMRDFLDTQKVDEVKNGEVDTDHATPDGTFGYAPMNWRWTSPGPKVGGKFLRPTVDAAEDLERKRIWSVEVANPVLSEDFYIVSEMHIKPFLDQEAEPFELVISGENAIEGNTQFGPLLAEATGNYDAVAEKAPTDRIDPDA